MSRRSVPRLSTRWQVALWLVVAILAAIRVPLNVADGDYAQAVDCLLIAFMALIIAGYMGESA